MSSSMEKSLRKVVKRKLDLQPSGTVLLKTKLAPPKPAQDDSPTENVAFICNCLSSKENRLSMELDDDTFNSLCKVGNKFSSAKTFKSPLKKGTGLYEGRYFANMLCLLDSSPYVRKQVQVRATAQVYGPFENDKGETIHGWKLVIDSIEPHVFANEEE